MIDEYPYDGDGGRRLRCSLERVGFFFILLLMLFLSLRTFVRTWERFASMEVSRFVRVWCKVLKVDLVDDLGSMQVLSRLGWWLSRVIPSHILTPFPLFPHGERPSTSRPSR